MEPQLRITARERQALLEQYRKGVNPRVRLRAHTLLLLAQGYSWALIASALFCSTRTIARWKRRVETEGISAILGPPVPPASRLGTWWEGGRGSLGAGVEAAAFWIFAQSVVLWGDCPAVGEDPRAVRQSRNGAALAASGTSRVLVVQSDIDPAQVDAHAIDPARQGPCRAGDQCRRRRAPVEPAPEGAIPFQRSCCHRPVSSAWHWRR
jgi:Homeodomain-like domain